MKEHAKKALKHDIELLGKTVPTIAVLALFLIGSGSAALLTNFGTVSGTADVDQAVELTGGSDFSFDTNQVAGETVVETRTLKSNADVSTQIKFETTCNSTTETGTFANFSEDCEGIDTRYVEYFDDAGHDFNSYSTPDSTEVDVTVEDQKGLEDAVSNDQPQTVLVKAGSYDGITVSDADTVVAESRPDEGNTATVKGRKTGIDVTADEATVKGFEVTADAGDDGYVNARGIDIKASGVTVESNYIHDVTDEERPIGIHLWSKNSPVSNAEIVNNYVEDVNATQYLGDQHTISKARGIALTGTDNQKAADNVEISSNTVENIGNQSTALASAINIYGGAQNFNVTSNKIGSVDHKVSDEVQYDLGVYLSGYSGDGDYGSNAQVTRNNFVSTDLNYVDIATYVEGSTSGAFDAANNNWFGTNGMHVARTVNASWADADTTVEANTDDKFGIVNEFAINLKPDTYSLTTSIIPANGEETTS